MQVRERDAVSGGGSERSATRGKVALQVEGLDAAKKATGVQLALETPGTEAHETARILDTVQGIKKEIFHREHDATGAWKRERFGRDLAADLGKRSWERDGDGKLVETPDDERSHVLLVNMGELDRLNDLGDHSLGDTGLRLTAERIEATVREVLAGRPEYKDERRLADAYDMYRYSGNDFSVTLRDVDPDDAEEIMRRVSMDPIAVPGGGDPVPLVASRVSRADGVSLLNGIDETPEDAKLDVRRVLIDAMLEKAQALNDARKVGKRVHRMTDMILAIESGTMTEEDVKRHYDKYFRKSLGRVFARPEAEDALDFEGFRRVVREGGASSDKQERAKFLHEITERSLDAACREMRNRREFGRSIERKLAARIAEESLNRGLEFGDLPLSVRGVDNEQSAAPAKPTRGVERLEELQRRAEKASTGAGAGGRQAAEAALAKATYELERAKRDSGSPMFEVKRTGLYQRGVYFDVMEEAFGSGKRVSTAAIDMAFLKYFDKEGGAGAGDFAILKAAEILDTIAESSTVRDAEGKIVVGVEAYRLGGDEFAFTVVGGDDTTMPELRRRLEDAAVKAGRIPAQAGATEAYRPELLNFNVGVREARDAASFRMELEGYGIRLASALGSPEEPNELAEYLMRMADKESGLQKSVSRAALIVGRLMKNGFDPGHPDLKGVVTHSSKAVFGRMDDLVALARRAAADPDGLASVVGDIHRFAIENIDKKLEENAAYGASMDRVLEDAVRMRYFDQRIKELEDTVAGYEIRHEQDHEAANRERGEKEAASREHAALVDIRSRIQGVQNATTMPRKSG
ncbi:MAG: hypothetical protein V1745_02130 [Patescibacteria group bacterium]